MKLEDAKLAGGFGLGGAQRLDGGKQWAALKGNMPIVPVHDLVVHPREGDFSR